MPETAQQISEKPEVRKELAQTPGEKKPSEKIKARATDKFWFVTHGLVLIGCAMLYYLIGSKFIPLVQTEVDFSQRILRGFALIVVILATAKAVRVYAIGRIEDAVTRFTLQRIQYLVVGVLIAVIAISVIFVNWYAALTALGIGSIIVGLAVQTPMKSFIAWIYILVRRPYQDRRCYRRCNRCRLSRHDAVGIWRSIYLRRSPERARHPVSERESTRL